MNGYPPSDWQTQQVLGEFPNVFSDLAGMKGAAHGIITPPGVIVQAPLRATPLALRDVVEQEVQIRGDTRVLQPLCLCLSWTDRYPFV